MCRFNSGVGSPWHFGPVIRSSDPGVCAVLLQTRAPRQVQVLLESRVRHTVRVRAITILTSAPSRPDVTFFCDLDYDPFLYMQDHEKVYGEHFDRMDSSLPGADPRGRIHYRPPRVPCDHQKT